MTKTMNGTPESAAEFRAAVEEAGQTLGGIAKWMQRLGDDRPAENIRRTLQRIASGEARYSGEMRVVMGVLKGSAAKRARAEKAGLAADGVVAPQVLGALGIG